MKFVKRAQNHTSEFGEFMKGDKTMFWENLVNLCNKNNTTPTAVVNTLGIAGGSVTKWRNGSAPRATTLAKIADYFGVTVEYFFINHKEDKPSTPTFISYQHDNEDARKLLANMKGLGVFNIPPQTKKPTDYGELLENISFYRQDGKTYVLYNRNGKQEKKQYTQEQLALFRAMFDAIPKDPDDNTGL